MATLLAYAAPREGASMLGKGLDKGLELVELGVGKIAATMSSTVALAPPQTRPDAVLLFGVCGAYPTRHLRAGLSELQVLDTCVVESEMLVDDGVSTPEGFLDLAQLGLGEIGPLPCELELSAKISAALACPLVRGATVSTGAGTEALSRAYAQRSGAQVESMEGGAVALVCRRFGVPFVELRVVSNRTGDRGRSGWDLDGAVGALARALEQLLAHGALLP